MTDLLSQRLIAAKRELTALKTAHRRGLGLVKIYQKNIEIDTSGHEDGVYYLTLQIKFDRNFAAFPFVDSLQNGQDDYASLLNQGYADGGFSMYQEFLWITDTSAPGHFISIFSTTPVSEVTYSWSNNR